MLEGYLGYSRVDWERMAQTTLAQHVRELEDATLRSYQMPAMILAGGRFMGSQRGRGIDWPVKYRNHPVEGNTGQTPRQFGRHNLYQNAHTDWRGYQTTDAMYEAEFLMNGPGETQIIDVFNGFVDRLTTSMDEFLASQYYIDGDDADNLDFWQGLDTIYKFAGTINIATGVARNANTADKVAYPYGTYADLDMRLGAYGGANHSGLIWPAGLSDPQFDFWSPLGVITDHTDFVASATPLYDAVRYGLTQADRSRSLSGQITNVMFDRDGFSSLKSQAETKERIIVTSENGLRALGFKDTIIFDGRELSWEVAIAPETGYGFNFANIGMRSLYPQLTNPEGPFYDYKEQAYHGIVKNLSNLMYKSPRNFAKWLTTTAAGNAPA